ncbi:sensory neuron membrane protein 1-like [Culicoides brevitarsis]|uniref:sensory neuron membrane protein 1-like n=1 Tax=Culicoides brevitarsis TaxID=469753 RepID=UPI00307B7E9D
MMRDMFVKTPFALTFKVYMFNVKNPDEAQNGGRPIVEQVGPYIFDEWKEKWDLVDDEKEDTVEYDMKNTFIFRPDLTLPLTGREIVTIPHPLLMGALIVTKRESDTLLPMVIEGLDAILHNPTTPFLTASVMDILFNGVPLDCTGEVFSAEAICAKLVNDGGLPKINETHVAFSLFTKANGTSMGRFKAYRGVKNVHDMGRVIEYNGEPEMDTWDGDICNQFKGTDSTIFPPFLTKEEGLWAFAPDLCRSLGTEYIGKSKYMGIKLDHFSINFPDLREHEELQCFCRDPPDGCPPKGVIELYQCVEFPMTGSKPQFLDGDPKLIEDIGGLSPNKEDHDIFIHYDLMTAAALSAAKRLQFNLDIEPVEEYPLMKDLKNVMFPLFWVEEGVNLNKTWVNMFKMLVRVKTGNNVIRWLFVTFGLIGAILSAYLLVQNEDKILKVTPVETSKAPSGGSISENILTNFLIVPTIVRFFMSRKMNMKPGHYLRKVHKRLDLHASYYLWNITNPEEVQNNGAKPIMKEVGPYVFDIRREKINQEDNDKDDTWTFDSYSFYKFRPDLSAPLTGDEKLVMLNNILVAGAVKFQLERPPTVNFMEAAINAIFDNPTSIYFHTTAREILFDGVSIDCSVKVFAAKTVCSFLKKDIRIRPNDATGIYNFAILNGVRRFTTKRGAKDPHDVGRITEFNGEPQLYKFSGELEACNKFNGSDRTMFPAFQTKDELVWAFVFDACRSVVGRYKKKQWMKGIKAYYKEYNFLDPELPSECNKNEFYPEIPSGTMNIHPCTEVFVIVSHPHFLRGDKKLLEMVEGLHPNEDLHSSGIYFDLDSGAPIKTYERAQVNTLLLPVPEIPIMANVPEAFVPFYWYTEIFDLDKISIAWILLSNYTNYFFSFLCYPLMILSLGMIGALTFIFMTNRIPGTPEVGENSHKNIEVAVIEINNPQ